MHRIIGTVIHETIAFPGIEAMHRLKALGLSQQDVPKALDMIQIARINMQHDPRAQWMLNPTHQNAQSEYPITAIIDGKIRHFIVDRTFVEHGVRWIIDYKTSLPKHDESQADFIAREQAAYKMQLETYAKAFEALDNHPIKMGLYFPMISGWIEWKISQIN